MPEGNSDLLRRYFDAANRRDFDEVMDIYAEDVVMIVPDAWLIGGTFEGKDAVGRWFGDWYRTFGGGPQFEVVDTVEHGERVALAAQAHSRGRRSGVELDADYFYVFRIEDGKIVHLQFYASWSEALEALSSD